MRFCPQCRADVPIDVIPGFHHHDQLTPSFAVCVHCGWLLSPPEEGVVA